MTPQLSVTRDRIKRLLDERVELNRLHELMLGDIEKREDDKQPNEGETETLNRYRTRTEEIDTEVKDLHEVLEREEKAAETSRIVRAHLAGTDGSTDEVDGQKVYKTFASYARDEMIARMPKIAQEAGGEIARMKATERLAVAKRTPEHTLSSDVDGLIPPVHIAQIMDVIDKARPVVVSGNRVDLSRGKLTWPKITQRPIARVQGTEKTEPNTQKMEVELKDAAADTYVAAGNLSWQAINWTTPDALALWFNLAAEAYARLTEANACHVLAKAATSIMTPLTGDGSDTFDDWVTAILAGIEGVYDATRAVPNRLYLSPDMFFLAAAVTSDSRIMLIQPGSVDVRGLTGTIAQLQVVTSPGFDTGTAIVGDSNALLVGETAGAPVELRAVEPAIGGLEVGLIGAFKAISFDDERFSDIGPTT